MIQAFRRLVASVPAATCAIGRRLVPALAIAAASSTLMGAQDALPKNACYRFDRPYFAAMDYGTGVQHATAIVRLDTVVFEQHGDRVRRLSAFEVDSVVLHSRIWSQFPFWKPLGDSLFVAWHTGLSGPLLTLAVRGDSLVGRVVFDSDVVSLDRVTRRPLPRPSEPASATKVACPPSAP